MAGSGEQDSPPGDTVTMAVCHADGIDDPAFVGGSAPVSVVGRRSGVQRCLDHAQALRRSCMQKGLEHFSSSFDGNRYRHSRRNDGVSDHCGRLQTQSGGLPSRLFPQASQVRRRFRPRIHPAIDLPIFPGPLPWIGDNAPAKQKLRSICPNARDQLCFARDCGSEASDSARPGISTRGAENSCSGKTRTWRRFVRNAIAHRSMTKKRLANPIRE